MKQFSYVLTCLDGLHVRRVNALAREAARFSSSVRIYKGELCAAADNFKALLALGAVGGDRVRVMVDGRDEEAAVAAMQYHFVSNL